MSSRLERFPVPPGATLTVVDRYGAILAGTPQVGASVGRNADAAGFSLALHTPEGVSEGAGLDGQRRVHGHFAVSLSGGGPDLVVVAGVAREPLLAPVKALVLNTTRGYLVVLLLGLVAAWLIGDMLLVRRLKRLAVIARRFSDGDLTARTGLVSKDEIGSLARTFDEMALAVDRLTRRNRLILESAGVGIYGVDVDGAITMMNPAAAAMLGCAPADVIGQKAHELLYRHGVSTAPSDAGTCPVFAALGDGEVHRGDGEVLWRADGTSFPTEYVATPIRDEGAIVGAVVTFRDITERRQLEAQLRQAQKMEAIGRLAGGVAHDFNNLLTVVLSIGESLAEALPTDHALHGDVAELVSAGRRGADLTRQLLAFSRKQVLAPVALDPNALVQGLQRLLERLIGEDVRIVTALSARGQVLADRGQLEQVIVNLVVNARDAMPRGGTVTISAADVDRPASPSDRFDTPPGRYVLLSVADTGTGMDERTLSRIFEPFFTTKGPCAGTGLGLSMVYGIVKQSGGDIRVESAPAHGSRFDILLPACEVAENAGPREPARSRTAPRSRGECVLVVEDNPLVRAVTCRTLTAAGYQVVEVATAEDALQEEARGEPIELVVTDVVLPGLNGRELADRLQSERPGLKILFVSGYTGGAMVDSDVPADAYLQKPFTPDALLGRVRDLLDHERPAA
jgi:PAS domain S-box-containing protein